ncbi:MAG: hypothetical protein JWR80_6831 [Bradyrhizobium sp.]|nr:hypothetical protein [Bradyrhizobium sp.]
MISSQFSPCVAFTIKVLAVIVAAVAAGVGWNAARLWLRESKIEMPPFDPPVASIDDAPALHVMSTMVQLNGTVDALTASGTLNAAAAQWTALAAILGGLTAILGAL